MPVYTYRCDNCGVQFDHQQHFSDKPLVRCPECHHKTLRRVYRPVGIVFKGSGFYVTDNRSASSSLPAKSTEKKSKPKESSDSDTKSSSQD